MTLQVPGKADEKSAPSQLDPRDRLILALYAQLKAERETRCAFEEAIANGVLSKEVLQALLADPVPPVTGEHIAAIERVLAREPPRNDLEPEPRRRLGR